MEKFRDVTVLLQSFHRQNRLFIPHRITPSCHASTWKHTFTCSHSIINMKNQPAFHANILLHTFTPLLSSALRDGIHKNVSAVGSVQLASFFSPSDAGLTNEDFICPSLHLRGHISGLGQPVHNFSRMDIAALKFSAPLEVNYSTLQSVPERLLHNVMFSFNQLLSSRLRNANMALLKNVIKEANQLQIGTLEKLLLQRKPIKISNVAVSFRIQDVQNGAKMNVLSNSSSLPLIFEVKIDLDILGIEHKVHLKSRGTISCNLDPNTFLFQSVHVAFDTVQLLRMMIDNVKLTVKKTLRRAVKITSSYVQLKCNIEAAKNRNICHSGLVHSQTFDNQDLRTNYQEHVLSNMKDVRESHQIPSELTSHLKKYPINVARAIIELANCPCYDLEAGIDTDVSRRPVVASSPEVTLKRLRQSSTIIRESNINACESDGKRKSSDSSEHRDSPVRKRVCWSQPVAEV